MLKKIIKRTLKDFSLIKKKNITSPWSKQTYAKGTCFDRKLKKITKIIIGHKYSLSGYLKKCIIRYVEINKKKVAWWSTNGVPEIVYAKVEKHRVYTKEINLFLISSEMKK